MINANYFIDKDGNGNYRSPFDGDLRDKFYATDKTNGTPGRYTRKSGSEEWTKIY